MPSSSNLYLRDFRREDLSSVFRLVQHTIDSSYIKVYPPEAVLFFKQHHSNENIWKDAKDGGTLVWEQNGEILGTGTLLKAEIRRVFVNPPHQHRGVGKAIATELENRARLARIATLDLAASLVSRQFWESLGFDMIRPDHIPVGRGQQLHFYWMSKRLTDFP
jgi:N-acetylglutamate synthase-like GNAT family acetyltransferase